jgi:hypothetical protein
MCAALFMPGKISPRFVIASIIMEPISILLAKYALSLPFDFIYFGMMVCARANGAGALLTKAVFA